MKEIKTIWKNHKPYGIKDECGFLFFFTKITHFPGQDERYRNEIAEQINLADDLENFLKTR